MDYLLTVCLSLALLVAVAVLLRERRLRLALQRLVHRLLSLWRSDERSQTDDPAPGDPAPSGPVDRRMRVGGQTADAGAAPAGRNEPGNDAIKPGGGTGD